MAKSKERHYIVDVREEDDGYGEYVSFAVCSPDSRCTNCGVCRRGSGAVRRWEVIHPDWSMFCIVDSYPEAISVRNEDSWDRDVRASEYTIRPLWMLPEEVQFLRDWEP